MNNDNHAKKQAHWYVATLISAMCAILDGSDRVCNGELAENHGATINVIPSLVEIAQRQLPRVHQIPIPVDNYCIKLWRRIASGVDEANRLLFQDVEKQILPLLRCDTVRSRAARGTPPCMYMKNAETQNAMAEGRCVLSFLTWFYSSFASAHNRRSFVILETSTYRLMLNIELGSINTGIGWLNYMKGEDIGRSRHCRSAILRKCYQCAPTSA